MKITIIALVMAFVFLMIQQSCQKATSPEPNPEPAPGPSTGNGPKLPATPYDYTSTAEIPAYLADFIKKNPGIDNTPSTNPITNAGATLGRVLFYDKQLSANNKISCASCHHQDKGFTDGKAASSGFEGKHTRRNSMATINLRYFPAKKMFWDLRAADLETQTLMPIRDQIEMGMPSLQALEEKLRSISYYPSLFKSAFGSTDITSDRVSKALSQFMRSIISFNSKYDQGLSNNFVAFSQQEINGKNLVIKAFCTECHSDLSTVSSKSNPTFFIVDNFGLNTGFGSNNGLDEVYTDNGIGEITKKAEDMGTFKIPTLRNIELTAPYMHDGRFATLEQVVDHYATGVKSHANRGVQVVAGGFKFSEQEKKDIIAFLKTLTDHSLATKPKYSDPFK